MLAIKLIFGTLLSLGAFVLFIIAFKVYYKYLLQESKCIKKTSGEVIAYTKISRGPEGSGIHLPIVSYEVSSQQFKVVGPEFKAFKTYSHSSTIETNTIKSCYEKDQVLYIDCSINSHFGLIKNPLVEYYPIGTRLDVFYAPDKPKLAYVQRYCNRKWAFYLTFVTAISLLLMDLLIVILLP